MYFELRSPISLRFPAFFDFRAPAASFRRAISYEGFIKQNHVPIPQHYAASGQKNLFIQDLNPWEKAQAAFYDDVYNQIYFRNDLAKHFKPLFPKKMYQTEEKVCAYIKSKQTTDETWHAPV